MEICENPVFIIGSPRSGSTILAWSLAQHDDLWTSGESHFLWRLFGASNHLEKVYECVGSWPGGSWITDQGVTRAEFFAHLGIGLNALFTSRSHGRRWIDQTPYYVYMADQLADMFPGARFLHVLRDGRRVVNSMTHFSGAVASDTYKELLGSGRLQGWPTDFREACREWGRSVQAALNFAGRRPELTLSVRQESLESTPNVAFAAVFRFLAIPYQDAPLKYIQTNRINSSFPRPNFGVPAHPGLASDPWCGWDAEHRQIFVEEAGDVLIECGMAREGDLYISDHLRYLFCLRKIARRSLHLDSLALVITGGDDTLLNLGLHRLPWHFPRTPDGYYGGNPEGSEQAITHLEDLRRQGAQYLLVPSWSSWWMVHYPGFANHLRRRYTLALEDDGCLLFRL